MSAKENYLTPELARDFLKANPTVQWIDVFMFDVNGVARGKRLRASDFAAFAGKTIMFPSTVYIMDMRGSCVESTGRLWETGDPDLEFRVLADTLAPISVEGGIYAQAVMVPVGDGEGLDPRRILEKQVARFTTRGQKPVAAVELEFYVSVANTGGPFTLKVPHGLEANPDWQQLYQFEEMDTASAFIDDIYKTAELQNIPVDAVIQEAGPGQFEINLKHRDDLVAAALDALLLKRAVKAAALVHGMEATFMAKPHHDWSGSGMHVHMSLVDDKGQNLFAGDPISPLFRHALGGLRSTMGDFMAVWAQSANAYRRYQPKSYVPMAAHWGFNNRTVSLRVLNTSPAATRVEHRIAGADANPYLVLAAILAGADYGIRNQLDPGPESKGNAADGGAGLELPTAWINAIEVFESSPVVREAFGSVFQTVYTSMKDTERTDFERVVTALDHQWYARVA
ncbi:MAG: glutamine synthetase family protein [Hyphomicrobium sp.]|nr:glutamine synthetase family protein [Hyphomicrobium sp.]